MCHGRKQEVQCSYYPPQPTPAPSHRHKVEYKIILRTKTIHKGGK